MSPRDHSLRSKITSEILGPKSCQQCMKSIERNGICGREDKFDRSKNEDDTPMEFSNQNISEVNLLDKRRQEFCALPQTDFSKPSARQISSTNLSSRPKSSASLHSNQEETKSILDSVKQTKSNLFFSDMDDLRKKIYLGIIPKARNIGAKSQWTKYTILPKLSPLNQPREISVQKSFSKAAPPVMPIQNQDAGVSFYAGQDAQCPPVSPLPVNEDYLAAIGEMLTENAT